MVAEVIGWFSTMLGLGKVVGETDGEDRWSCRSCDGERIHVWHDGDIDGLACGDGNIACDDGKCSRHAMKCAKERGGIFIDRKSVV